MYPFRVIFLKRILPFFFSWSFGALLIEVVSLGKDPEVVTSSSKCHPMILKESPRRMLQSVTSRRNELSVFCQFS